MKATGMVRRIDELGRIVIPKEIRKTLKIKVGDELEVYTEDDGVLVMRKHSRIMTFGTTAKGVVEAIYRSLGGTVILSDSSHILYVSGAYRNNYEGKELTDNLLRIIDRRRGSILSQDNIVDIVRDDDRYYDNCYVTPIIAGGDIYGSLIMLTKDGDINEAVPVLDTAASFLALNLSE